jgi:molecular chaperone GrpE
MTEAQSGKRKVKKDKAAAKPGEAGAETQAPGEAEPPVGGEAPKPEAAEAGEPGAEKPEEAGPAEAAGEEKPEPEAEIARLNDRLLRALADLENLHRRAEREREEIARYAVTGFSREILTVADNLRRALDAIPAHAREGDELLNNLAVGVEVTERELLAAFERQGIRRIEPLGDKFNHDLHQAMFEVENTGKPPRTVVEVLQVGYLLHDRLLRPAMVALARGEPEERKVDTSA